MDGSHHAWLEERGPKLVLSFRFKDRDLAYRRVVEPKPAASELAPVNIEYSLDNGTSYTSALGKLLYAGKYDWSTPGTKSPACLVRISDADGGTFKPDKISYEINIQTSGQDLSTESGPDLNIHLAIPDSDNKALWCSNVTFLPDYSTELLPKNWTGGISGF